jgi:hypothetical protein
MIRLELNEEESNTLNKLLDTSLAELKKEIIDTDNINYKIMLKKRKAVLKKLQHSLRTFSNQPETTTK